MNLIKKLTSMHQTSKTSSKAEIYISELVLTDSQALWFKTYFTQILKNKNTLSQLIVRILIKLENE